MKNNLHFFRSVACLMAFAAAMMPRLRAADDAPPANANIRLDVLMLSMPEEKFVTLLPDLLDKEKIEKAVPDLLDAVKRKEITLVGYPFVTTKSGQRAVAETVKEIRYSTGMTQEEAINDELKNLIAYYAQGNFAIVDPATPTSMETRNAGVSFEVEPTISEDGKHIDINLAPQHVELIGFIDPDKPAEARSLKEGAKSPASVPLFLTTKEFTSVTLLSGRHMLLGIHKKADGEVEIYILHAEILTPRK